VTRFAISARAAVFIALFVLLAIAFIAAPLLAPQNPYDLAAVDLFDARTPPFSANADTGRFFVFGADDQGRDILSAILYGGRLSLFIGFAAAAMAAILGGGLGLLCGYAGGWLDAAIMRLADVQLAMPGFLIALFIMGVVAGAGLAGEATIIAVLVFSIGLSEWVQFARVARAAAMVQKRLGYVEAARVAGVAPAVIMFRHLLINIAGPILVIMPIALAAAIQLEATLSFLGVGMPPTRPSLGTLINIGRDYLFSGESWIALFPACALVLLVLSVNFIGDYLRDALNPKL
jgi:peptide/nickel transport system permease protein